jgi:thioredoxin reductase
MSMSKLNDFEIIILGGSYAGLSAAMALGRAMRKVLVIDNGLPCNRTAPHSHNFLTQDGEKPSVIAAKAKQQVQQYPTVQFLTDLAIAGEKTVHNFIITTQAGNTYTAKKLLFATGLKDNMPAVKGFSECWGISIIHCPYCHGYEVKNEKTAILANGDFAYHYAQLIRNWTKELTVFTNGKSTLTREQSQRIQQHGIAIIEKRIELLHHENGMVKKIILEDNTTADCKAIYAMPDFEQHSKIPISLGCELTQHGLIKTDLFQKTTVENVFACGDSTSMLRSVANAVFTGNIAGVVINNTMTEEAFNN